MKIEPILHELSTMGRTPNKFTLRMGELIREARREAGMTQAELAESTYLRRPSLSAIENGKMIPDAETLLLLAVALNVPLARFFPSRYAPFVCIGDLTPEEQELLQEARRLGPDDLRKLVAQARALADLSQQAPDTRAQLSHQRIADG
jgi:transcriptional regulator with XRE-family HTH domain